MQPFNLERALAGDKVVTRGGLSATNIKYKEHYKIVCATIAAFDCSFRDQFFTDGKHDTKGEHPLDLFMAE